MEDEAVSQSPWMETTFLYESVGVRKWRGAAPASFEGDLITFSSVFLFVVTGFVLCWSCVGPVPFPPVFAMHLQRFSAGSRCMSHMKGAPEDRRVAGALFIYFSRWWQLKDSKHTKLCMSYDVICSTLSSPLGRASKFISSGFSSRGHTTNLQIGAWGCFPSYITHKSLPDNKQLNSLIIYSFPPFDVRWDWECKAKASR